jgi:hypothetical protein
MMGTTVSTGYPEMVQGAKILAMEMKAASMQGHHLFIAAPTERGKLQRAQLFHAIFPGGPATGEDIGPFHKWEGHIAVADP